MLVTITNVSEDKVYVSMVYSSIEPNKFITTRRTSNQLNEEYQLIELQSQGKVVLTFQAEPGDSAISSPGLLPVYAQLDLPDPSTLPIGSLVWNSDDNAPNYADGGVWRDAAGQITAVV